MRGLNSYDLSPAATCCGCGLTLGAIGGRRLVETHSIGVAAIPAKGDTGGRMKRSRVSGTSPFALGTFGPQSFWTSDRVDRASFDISSNGERPWLCQRCTGYCCPRCDRALVRPAGATDIDGNYFALLPGNAVCECGPKVPVANRLRKWEPPLKRLNIGWFQSLIAPELIKGVQTIPASLNFKTTLLDIALFRGGEKYQIFRGSYLNPNPHLYKYYWVLVTTSPLPFSWQPTGQVYPWGLCTYDYSMIIEIFRRENLSYITFNNRLPRKDSSNPFTEAKSDSWAPKYSDDTDPPFEGHK